MAMQSMVDGPGGREIELEASGYVEHLREEERREYLDRLVLNLDRRVAALELRVAELTDQQLLRVRHD